MESVYRAFTATIDDVNKTDRSITAKINDFSVDRYASAIDPRGADLRSFTKNPCVLWEHGKDITNRGPLPIGKNLWIRVDRSTNPKIIARTQFLKDPFSQMLYEAYSEGELRAWSVSLLPKDYGPPKPEEIRARPDFRDCEVIYRTWELAEYSAVSIGGNSNCLTEDEIRSCQKLVIRGFWTPPIEIKDQLDRAMTEGSGLASGGALVKPDDCDDDDKDEDRDCGEGMEPKKRKKKDADDGDDDDDAPETVDEGTLVAGGGGIAIVGMSGEDAGTVDRYIRKEDGKFNVYSEEGKLLGSHDTREDAVKQLQAIEANKHRSAPDFEPAPEPEPDPVADPEPEPVVELPPLTGRTFQEIVALHILEERDYRARLLQKFQDRLEWLQGKA